MSGDAKPRLRAPNHSCRLPLMAPIQYQLFTPTGCLFFPFPVFTYPDGFWFGTSDDTAFAPWLLQIDDPGLYLNDLRFGDFPGTCFTFHIYGIYALGALIPLQWSIGSASVVSKLILLVGLQRLGRCLTGQYVSALLFAVLMVGYLNSYVLGGYYLYSRGFSTRFLALALVVVGLADYVDARRLLPAAVVWCWRSSSTLVLVSCAASSHAFVLLQP